ncbi:helix-turn-helix domain-containing protein [Kitasatospora gansuensis]
MVRACGSWYWQHPAPDDPSGWGHDRARRTHLDHPGPREAPDGAGRLPPGLPGPDHPEAVGLPPGPRRRTPGLRREELAQLAGVGVTWYTWLEQGRPINASEQVLEAVARTLRLDGTERDHLFRLAGLSVVRTGDPAFPTLERPPS